MKTQSPWILALVIVGALFLLTLAILKPVVPPAPLPRAGHVAVVGGDEATLRVAMTRFLDLRSPRGSTRREALLVGQLPPDMAFDLPVPGGTRVVGSLVGGPPSQVRVILDSERAQDALLALYSDSFMQQGFIQQEVMDYQVLPINPHDLASYASFCRASDSLFVNVMVEPGEDVPSTVGVLTYQSDTECPRPPRVDPDTVQALLPELHHPSTAWLNDVVGGGTIGAGPDQATSTTGINVKMAPGDLAEFYSAQLEAAGWTMSTQSASEQGAWSTWSLKDAEGQPWTGSLVIVASPTTDQKIITLDVMRQ